jgi:nucleotide-binding universal stress UspA family protein
MSTQAIDLTRALDARKTETADTPRFNRIVVASDGSEEPVPALAMAREFARRDGAQLHAVSVYQPAPIVTDSSLVPLYIPEDVDAACDTRRRRVEEQVRTVVGASLACPVTVRVGRVAEEVLEFTRSVAADLLITGRGRHGMVDRLLGEEHLARVLRNADCPVLAADFSLSSLPRRIAVGVDFSRYNSAVVRTALAAAQPDAALYLVHVKPDPPFGMPHPGQWLKSYEDGVRAGLEHLRNELALPPSRVVENVVLHGHPGAALAEFATQSGTDLLAVGVHGAGFFNRLVIGSVTNYLLRAAPCSLLAVPSHEGNARASDARHAAPKP